MNGRYFRSLLNTQRESEWDESIALPCADSTHT